MKRKINFLLTLALGIPVLCSSLSCQKGFTDETTEAVNTYIAETMYEAYLWEDYMPEKVYPKNESDPFALFEKLCYRNLDKWSTLTDDYTTFMAELNGTIPSYGYSLSFGTFSNSGNLFAIVTYVYPDTPADKAGIKRGDVIMEMNEEAINESNYLKIFNNGTMKLSIGEYNPSTSSIAKTGVITLTPVSMELSPIIENKVIDVEGHKIGYLCYSDFFNTSVSALNEVFSDFKSEGVQDVVLDLRYNLGGYVTTAVHLSSILAPKSCLSNPSLLMTCRYNELYQTYYQQNDTTQLYCYFEPKVPVNMDLNRIYILTSKNTASASELTLSGLMPYMDVTLIGGTTRGKYTGAGVIRAKNSIITNWAMMLVIFRYANAKGVTDFVNGFTPDYEVEDYLLDNMHPLGDPDEAMLAKAISLITGSQSANTKAPAIPTGFTMRPDLNPRPDPCQGNIIFTQLSDLK